MINPEWVQVGGADSRTHLVANNAIRFQSWCGQDLSNGTDAPYAHRCKNCLTALATYVHEANVEPPKTITESFQVEVTHSVTVTNVHELIAYRLTKSPKNSWTVEVTPVERSSNEG